MLVDQRGGPDLTGGITTAQPVLKNSGRGQPGWLPLVRLTAPVAALDVVPAADRVSGTASGTDHPLWTA